MTPPDPTRMVDVLPATCPIKTEVAALAIPGMLWCSASQKRVNPHPSACCARSTVFRYASAIVPPVRTAARSRIENRGIYLRMFGVRSEERRVGKECRCGESAKQAEDGIRDIGVTGVQTCALPICGACNSRHVMVFGQPEARESPSVRVLREVDCIPIRFRNRSTCADSC